MPYADAGALSCNRRLSEGREGDVYDGGNDELIDGHVRDPRWADTGDGQWQSSWRNSNMTMRTGQADHIPPRGRRQHAS